MNPMKWPERFKQRQQPSIALTLMVLIPTRHRWSTFKRNAPTWLPSTPSNLKVRVVCLHDPDDQPPERLPGIEYVEVEAGLSKVEKWNRVPDEDWDILVMMGDDTTCELDDWEREVADRMLGEWPNLDGCLSWHQGFGPFDHIIHPIIGKNLWVRLDRKVWPEAYRSFYCDNELTEVLKALRRVTFLPYGLFEHHHPANPRFPRPADSVFKKDQANMAGDRLVFESRLKQMEPEVTLSVLIPSLTWRWEKRQRLLTHLNRLIASLPPRDRLRVEVLLDIDSGEKAVSMKRNGLVHRAKGKYVSFIDDDDMVSNNYFEALLTELDKNPDCVSFDIQYYNPTVPVEKAVHLLKEYPLWGFAVPNSKGVVEGGAGIHLSAVKRSLAMMTPYNPDVAVGEDWDFAKRIEKLFRKGRLVRIPEVLYFYLFTPGESTCSVIGWGGQSPKKPGRRPSQRKIERVRVGP